MTVTDRIEQEVTIDAPLERVWDLVAEPGWWVGDGDRSAQSRWQDGGLAVIDDPKYGRFSVRVETVHPREYVAYRWASGFPGQAPADGNSTLVEFWLTERVDGIGLRTSESGFSALAVSEPEQAAAVEGNTGGWRQQLDVVKRLAESPGPRR